MAHASTTYAPAATQSAGGSKALHLATRIFAWIAEERRIRRAESALAGLSDATLRDIGIERGDISQVARHGREVVQGRY
jgi:uncharacterized protein YjiS (DUF1127 family)